MRFSILLPTRNRLNLLKYAVETVIRQDYTDWEVIVSDNCSDEDVAGYVRSLADQRIKYYRTDRFLPVTENWNNALRHSTGDYFMMLGDDDCLMRGSLSTLHRLIDQHNEPDFIYMRALLYAYPGVLPGSPDGLLQTNGCAPFFVRSDEPFFLERGIALNVVHMSMDFRLPLEYNMQYSVVKRKFADALKAPFFQPPYPDYYATTALFLKGSRILICPMPLVTIGISTKSFGFFYYNDREEQGVEFLKNLSVPESLKHLEPLLLPGTNMNTSWLLAMETIKMNYGKDFNLRVNYRRYRSLQLLHLFQRYHQNPVGFAGLRKELLRRLSPPERLWYRAWLNLTGTIGHFFGGKAAEKAIRLLGLKSQYPAFAPYHCPRRFQNILEVFEQVTPEMGLAHACKQSALTKRNLPLLKSVRAMIGSAIPKLRSGGDEGLKSQPEQKVGSQIEQGDSYELWMKSHTPTAAQLGHMSQQSLEFSQRPLFSIAVPVYNVEEDWLRKCIESVMAQAYPYWELCLAADASMKPRMKRMLRKYETRDSRIRITHVRDSGHEADAMNSALSLATGGFLCPVRNPDQISPNALFEFAGLLNLHPDTDMIYSDEDRIGANGTRNEPFFKPDWSPEYFESCLYTGKLSCYKMDIARRIGGFRAGYEGAEAYDFVLRFVEQTQKIRHASEVLYHARTAPKPEIESTGSGAHVVESAVRALEDRLGRFRVAGVVKPSDSLSAYDVRPDITGNPLISIIIPTAGRRATIFNKAVDLLANCVNSIREKSTYRHYEIIIVDNDDLKDETVKAIKSSGCKFVHFKDEFNIAKKMNLGADRAEGAYLLFLNDDVEVISPDWLEAMLQLARRHGVGAVGAKLYFEDGTIQHVGVVLRNALPYHVYRGSPGSSSGYFLSSVVNRNYSAVTGACMMTYRKLFQEMGGFNLDFPVNYNDIDYCLRLREAGYRIVFTPKAQLYHFESLCRNSSVASWEMDRFQQLWRSKVPADPYYATHLSLLSPDLEI